jgi:hypothetical protein
MRRGLIAAILCAGAVCAARADVTLRYSFEVKPGAAMPPPAVEAMKSQLQTLPGFVTRLKGSQAFSAVMGFNAITDFNGALITILDPKGKRYVTVSSAEYVSAVSRQIELPPDARKLMEGMKIDAQARVTGRTSVIQGIQAEEREFVSVIEMPAGPQGPSRAMRMVYSVWAPRSDEIIRHPALQELAEYAARAYAGMNPADMMQKMFAQAPGMGEKMRAIMDEFKNARVILGARGAVYLPGMAAMMEQLRNAGKPVPPGFDVNAPMMEFIMDLQELSTEEVPMSAFEIPEGYTLGPIDEVLNNALPPRPGATKKP